MCSLIGEVWKHPPGNDDCWTPGLLDFQARLASLTYATMEMWRIHAGKNTTSQNHTSTTSSVLAMWLSLNSRSVKAGRL
jgi:hypothetical protein